MATYLPNITDVIPEPALFTPDFSFLDTMLRRRQALYEQGFAQVSGAYNFLNRDVTHAFNAQTKDQYLNEARSRLKNLSAMDLSQRQNVTAATQVFQPFYSNKSLLGDQALTAHWNQQEAIGESYRLKDGGKEFSEDNINYVRIQREQFRNDMPDSWGSYYSNRKSYTPYYNWTEEVMKAMDKFKPSSVKTIRKDGFYIYEETDKSAKEEDIRRYLSSVLSDKAKNQMQIEASVRLGSNPNNLALAYTAVANERVGVLESGIKQLDDAIKIEKNADIKAQYEQMRTQFKDELTEIGGNLDKISKNDLSDIKRNSDKLAFSIYYDSTIKRLANGFKYQEIDRDIKFDQVAMMMYREAQEWARKKYEVDNKNLTLAPLPTGIPSDEGDVTARTMADLQGNIDGAKAQMAQISNEVKAHIAQIKKLDVNKITEEMVNNYVSSPEGKKDKFIQDVLFGADPNKLSMPKIQTLLDLYENEIDAAEAEAGKGMKKEDLTKIETLKKTMKGLGSVRIGNTTITSEQVFQELVDKKNKPSEIGNRAGATTFTWDINGQTIRGVISGPQSDPNVRNLSNLVSQVQSAIYKNKDNINLYTKYNNSVIDYFNTKKTQVRTGLNYGDDSKQTKAAKSYLGGLLPNNYQPGNISGVLYDPSSRRVYFSLSGTESKPVNETEIVASLTSRGVKAGFNKAAGQFYIEGYGIPGSDAYTNLSPVELDILRVGQNAGKNYSSVPWYPAGFTDDRGNPRPGFRFEKTIDTGGKSSYYLYTDGISAPIRNKKYDDLYSLMIDAKLLALRPDKLAELVK